MPTSPFPLLLAGGYALVHGILVSLSPKSLRVKGRLLLVDFLLAFGFLTPVLWGLLERESGGRVRFLVFWGPVVFFWWAYLWSAHTLDALHPAGRTIDAWLIRLETRIGQPALTWAMGRSRSLTEALIALYFTYYLYTPVLGFILYVSHRDRDFQAMTAAVCLGYFVSYLCFSLVPAYGPRWSLVSSGLLEPSQQRLRGYWVTGLINRIMFGGPALKGGAMPSSHSSTAVVFAVWAWRIWGAEGGVPATLIALGMEIGAVYGRFHFVTDVLFGSLLGVVAILVTDAVMR